MMTLQLLAIVYLIAVTRTLALPAPPTLVLPGKLTTLQASSISNTPILQADQIGSWPELPFEHPSFLGIVQITNIFKPPNTTAEYALEVERDTRAMAPYFKRRATLWPEVRISSGEVKFNVFLLTGMTALDAFFLVGELAKMTASYGAASISGVYWDNKTTPEAEDVKGRQRGWFNLLLKGPHG